MGGLELTRDRDWWDTYWSVAVGCAKISAGCENCSAANAWANDTRLPGLATWSRHDVPQWSGQVHVQDAFGATYLAEMVQGSRYVFVAPYTDLFFEGVPDEVGDKVWAQVEADPDRIYVLLTKRAEAMHRYITARPVTPPNLWLMVSIEDEHVLDRIDWMLQTPATVHAVSCEPLLGPVDLRPFLGRDRVAWVTAGPEIGITRRPCEADWLRGLRDDCKDAGVPFYFKHILDGVKHREYP